ncbi:hypothetical protein [Arthrobacter sp. CAU 1506]|nr:hypothetical protein [Arthrobacter sp. CAU 1506]
MTNTRADATAPDMLRDWPGHYGDAGCSGGRAGGRAGGRDAGLSGGRA